MIFFLITSLKFQTRIHYIHIFTCLTYSTMVSYWSSLVIKLKCLHSKRPKCQVRTDERYCHLNTILKIIPLIMTSFISGKIIEKFQYHSDSLILIHFSESFRFSKLKMIKCYTLSRIGRIMLYKKLFSHFHSTIYHRYLGQIVVQLTECLLRK